jgi:hypothetical protein
VELGKRGERSVLGRLPEQKEAAELQEAVELEEQVLEEQGEQRQEEVLEPLEFQVSPEQEAGLSAPEFGVALFPLCFLMNEIPSGPECQLSLVLGWQPVFFGYFRLPYFSFETLRRNNPKARSSVKG